MLEKLQKNQESLTEGLQNVLMIQHMPEMIQEQQPLAIGYDIFDSGEELDSEKKKKKPIIKTDMNIGFDKDDLATLATYQLQSPTEVLHYSIDGSIDVDDLTKEVNEKIKQLGRSKAWLITRKQSRVKNKNKIDEITKDIKLLQKYRERIKIIPEGKKTIGTGLYTQPKRNAYKISTGGRYAI